MTADNAIISVILAALVLPGLACGVFTLRGGRLLWAMVTAGLFFAAAFALFAVASSAPHDDPDAVTQVLISFFVLIPAGLSAFFGAIIGRILTRRR